MDRLRDDLLPRKQKKVEKEKKSPEPGKDAFAGEMGESRAAGEKYEKKKNGGSHAGYAGKRQGHEKQKEAVSTQEKRRQHSSSLAAPQKGSQKEGAKGPCAPIPGGNAEKGEISVQLATRGKAEAKAMSGRCIETEGCAQRRQNDSRPRDIPGMAMDIFHGGTMFIRQSAIGRRAIF